MSYLKKIVFFFASLLFFLLFLKPVFAETLVWNERASMPTSRFVLNVVADANGHIYAAGGQANSTSLNNLEMYNPATDTWEIKTPAPVGSTDGGFTFNSFNGKFYYLSGDNSANFFEYDPETDTWMQKAGMPIDGFNIRIASVPSGKIYAIGGILNDPPTYTRLPNVYEYDPTTNAWITKSSIPNPVGGNCLITAPNGRIYVIGLDINGQVVDEYNPTTDTWNTKSSIPTPRDRPACSLNADGNIVVAGGNLDAFETITDVVEEYNPLTNTWSTLSPLPYKVADTGMALGSDNKLYIIGGKKFDNGNYSIINTNLSGTFVSQSPTNKEECKNGGWQQFTNPTFANQGECLKFVEHL